MIWWVRNTAATKGGGAIDPVEMFKTVLIQHFCGIPSLQQTMREIDMNMAYRWFLGYNFSKPVSHLATVSYAFAQRYNSEIAEKVYVWILYEAELAGYLNPEAVFVDATHVKASTNLRRTRKKTIPVAAKRYDEELRTEINTDWEAHGKSHLTMTARHLRKKRQSPQPTLRRSCSIRVNTRSVLSTVCAQCASETISFWM